MHHCRRQLRTTLFCLSTALAAATLAGCQTQNMPFVPVYLLPGGRNAVEVAKKLYAVQQKLKALNFTIRSDPAGGQFAFIATKEVKKVPLSLNVDLVQSPMTRAVSVAGIAVPLQGTGPVSFDAALRDALAGQGVPPPVITEVESNLNAALEAINTLGA